MSIRIMSAVWSLRLPDSEKLVLLALADCANDEGTCWPSMTSLVSKCSKSDRTIQASIKSLVAAGYLKRVERPGKGVLYTVTAHSPEATSPPKPLRPEESAPPKGATATPEAASDKPSRTTIPKKKASPSLGKRASSFPDAFIPIMSGKTLSTVELWPPGRIEDELDGFADHHRAKCTLSFDWQASWRTWVRNSKKWDSRNGTNRQSGGQLAPRVDGFTAALRQVADSET